MKNLKLGGNWEPFTANIVTVRHIILVTALMNCFHKFNKNINNQTEKSCPTIMWLTLRVDTRDTLPYFYRTEILPVII